MPVTRTEDLSHVSPVLVERPFRDRGQGVVPAVSSEACGQIEGEAEIRSGRVEDGEAAWTVDGRHESAAVAASPPDQAQPMESSEGFASVD